MVSSADSPSVEDSPTARNPFIDLRILLPALGVIAGAVGFAGFFLDFFTGSDSIRSGVSSSVRSGPHLHRTVGDRLFVPRFGVLFSELSLISLGVVFGLRGVISDIDVRSGASQPGYGVGFWTISVGAGALAIIWMIILALKFSIQVHSRVEYPPA